MKYCIRLLKRLVAGGAGGVFIFTKLARDPYSRAGHTRFP